MGSLPTYNLGEEDRRLYNYRLATIAEGDQISSSSPYATHPLTLEPRELVHPLY